MYKHRYINKYVYIYLYMYTYTYILILLNFEDKKDGIKLILIDFPPL